MQGVGFRDDLNGEIAGCASEETMFNLVSWSDMLRTFPSAASPT